ncbi:hypothetical protein NECAME_18839 [Necator americanus]|uniref:Uncharacterized protein n=1 Tax=Necator americanus TaxID=51031 RepID=W2SUS4_NECAM|nr:hypothetical protein NECAME_18839 [Necator americanus]ETN72452.1 hypothetical protein NECAME_18839 [Necator americanus]
MWMISPIFLLPNQSNPILKEERNENVHN